MVVSINLEMSKRDAESLLFALSNDDLKHFCISTAYFYKFNYVKSPNLGHDWTFLLDILKRLPAFYESCEKLQPKKSKRHSAG
jgi:hypothetical protein